MMLTLRGMQFEKAKPDRKGHKGGAVMNETTHRGTLLRSIGAALAGILTVIVLSLVSDMAMRKMGMFPAEGPPASALPFVLATGYRAIYSIAGSWVAARLAPSHPMRLAMILGWIGLVINLLGVAAAWNHQQQLGPLWYPIALAVLALPCAWLGGKLAGERLG